MYEDLVIEHFHTTSRDSTYLYKIMHTRKQKYYAGSCKSGAGPHWTIRGKVFHSLAAARESLRHLLTVDSVSYPEQNINEDTLGIVATITRPFCFVPAPVFLKYRDREIAAHMVNFSGVGSR
jgi:phage I-like protein